MKQLFRSIFFLLFVFVLSLTVHAHPGKTDSNGGHTDHSTGDYHYHHGQPAHDHYDIDGDGIIDCPYNFAETPASPKSSNSSSTSKQLSNDTPSDIPTNKSSSFSPIFLIYVCYCIIASISGLISLLISDHYEKTARRNVAKKFSTLSAVFIWTSFPWSLVLLVAVGTLYEAFTLVLSLFRYLATRK